MFISIIIKIPNFLTMNHSIYIYIYVFIIKQRLKWIATYVLLSIIGRQTIYIFYNTKKYKVWYKQLESLIRKCWIMNEYKKGQIYEL